VESEGFTAVVNHETNNKLPLINCLKRVYERYCGKRRVCCSAEP
jgi:hypothetical protein